MLIVHTVCSLCTSFFREIQAATGEWMNEYVRRPSRRRDNRVYVPAADIIKRSIRRSWTISSEYNGDGFIATNCTFKYIG
jgi:hypothetical protein